jgi:AcrR family transcriptional regulator
VTLHRRGVTKEGLLAELVARATEDYRAAMWPALTSNASGAERIVQALEALCAAAERNMALLLALRAQSDRIFHRDDSEEALTRTVFTEPLEKLLRDGIAEGSLREVDPVETATVLFNLVGWTYIHLRTGHGWNPERAVRATLDPVLQGMLTTTEGAVR